MLERWLAISPWKRAVKNVQDQRTSVQKPGGERGIGRAEAWSCWAFESIWGRFAWVLRAMGSHEGFWTGEWHEQIFYRLVWKTTWKARGPLSTGRWRGLLCKKKWIESLPLDKSLTNEVILMLARFGNTEIVWLSQVSPKTALKSVIPRLKSVIPRLKSVIPRETLAEWLYHPEVRKWGPGWSLN